MHENSMQQKQNIEVQSHNTTYQEHQHSDKMPAHNGYPQSLNTDQRGQQHEQAQLQQQEKYMDNNILQQQGKRAIQIIASSNSMGGNQPEDMALQTRTKSEEMQNFASQQKLKNQRSSKRGRDAKKRTRPQSEGPNNAGDQLKSNRQHAGKKARQDPITADANPGITADIAHVHVVKEVDTVVRKPGESISELIGRVQKDKEKEENLTQKEDNSEVMDNVSGRPYTGEQKKEVVIVLAQLLEKYGSDRVLTPLMVNYIDGVERRHKNTHVPSE